MVNWLRLLTWSGRSIWLVPSTKSHNYIKGYQPELAVIYVEAFNDVTIARDWEGSNEGYISFNLIFDLPTNYKVKVVSVVLLR